MKNLLLLSIAFLIAATVGLTVTAQDNPTPVEVVSFKELPPPLTGEEVSIVTEDTTTATVKPTESNHATNHVDDCSGFTPVACRPCKKQGRPLGNVLRWIFRPRCRWGRWR